MFNSLISSLSTKQPQLSHFKVGDQYLPIVRSARRKNIAIKQHKGVLVLSIPKVISAKRLNQILEQNHQWLADRVALLVENMPPKFKGLHGEVFMFFGQNHKLKWLEDELVNQPAGLTDSTAFIDLCGTSLEAGVYLNGALIDSQKQQYACQALEVFFKLQAEEYLQPKLDYYARQMGLSYHSVTVKGYKSRWGSCYSDGRIQFNWRLIQAPKWVVDYVIVHELAHLVHANHSPAFWELVQTHYPQTAQAKQFIKQHGRVWIDFLQ